MVERTGSSQATSDSTHPTSSWRQPPCGSWPPRGSGAAGPSGALRAIDGTTRPRSWRAFGLRRRRWQSEPVLLVTPVVSQDRHSRARCRERGARVGAWSSPAWGVARLRRTDAALGGECSPARWSLRPSQRPARTGCGARWCRSVDRMAGYVRFRTACHAWWGSWCAGLVGAYLSTPWWAVRHGTHLIWLRCVW